MRMLIVDGQQSDRALCATIGRELGLVCWQAKSAKEALERVESDAPELMLTDLVLGKNSGLELLAEVKKRSPLTEVALMSAHGTIESAVQAMRLGAHDFVVKPLCVEEFRSILERMVEKVELTRKKKLLHGKAQLESAPLSTDLEELERFTVQRVFEQVAGDKEQAQKLLGISRATLYRKLKRYGIRTRQMQPEGVEQKTQCAAQRMILLSQS